jgi:TolA-binding protein
MKSHCQPISAIVLVLATTGCLQTREDLKGKEEARHSQPVYHAPASAPPETAPAQGSNASGSVVVAGGDVFDLQEEIRRLNGRIEVLEHEVATLKATKTNDDTANALKEQELQTKIALLTESVAKLEEKVHAGVGTGASAASGAAAAPDESGSAEKNPYLKAEEDYKNKNWKQAIVNYQKYRTAQPNGKNYAAATYKIAVSFQELGMKQDAKAFFEEVIARFPNTEHAKKAQFRVKQIR